MLAGPVVPSPRLGNALCGGCRRIVPVSSMVSLDLPGGGWVAVCPRCYVADPVGRWRGSSVLWDGEGWQAAEEAA